MLLSVRGTRPYRSRPERKPADVAHAAWLSERPGRAGVRPAAGSRQVTAGHSRSWQVTAWTQVTSHEALSGTGSRARGLDAPPCVWLSSTPPRPAHVRRVPQPQSFCSPSHSSHFASRLSLSVVYSVPAFHASSPSWIIRHPSIRPETSRCAPLESRTLA